MTAQRGWAAWVLLGLVPFVGACSGSLNAVRGKVTHPEGPVKGAVVVFHPANADINTHRPTGVTDEKGEFKLTTGSKPGAAPGEYVVTVTWPAERKALSAKSGPRSTEQDDPTLPDRLNGRYANAKTSKLRATIQSGSNTLDPFELK